MNPENYSVEITITPDDAKFTERCEAAGLPLVVISMYKPALKRLVAGERNRYATLAEIEGMTPKDIARAIRNE